MKVKPCEVSTIFVDVHLVRLVVVQLLPDRGLVLRSQSENATFVVSINLRLGTQIWNKFQSKQNYSLSAEIISSLSTKLYFIVSSNTPSESTRQGTWLKGRTLGPRLKLLYYGLLFNRWSDSQLRGSPFDPLSLLNIDSRELVILERPNKNNEDPSAYRWQHWHVAFRLARNYLQQNSNNLVFIQEKYLQLI